jgi:hypothetical protein
MWFQLLSTPGVGVGKKTCFFISSRNFFPRRLMSMGQKHTAERRQIISGVRRAASSPRSSNFNSAMGVFPVNHQTCQDSGIDIGRTIHSENRWLEGFQVLKGPERCDTRGWF